MGIRRFYRNNSYDVSEYSSYVYPVTSVYIDKNCYCYSTVRNIDLCQVPFVDNNMSEAFNSSALQSITNLNQNVTNMVLTFDYCYDLVDANFIVPNTVTNMAWTFRDCSNLVNAPDMSNATGLTDMGETFLWCSNLVNAPDLSNCKNLNNLGSTFYDCYSLINPPSTIPNSVTRMAYTFSGCSNLVNPPDMSNANSVTNMCGTFQYCTNLVNAPVIPNSVIDVYGTFEYCVNLVNAPVIPNSVTNMASTFSSCENLVNVQVISNSVTNMASTFAHCNSLVNAPVIPNSVIVMSGTFSGCSNLINPPSTIPNSVTNMAATFSGCSNLINPPSTIPNSVTNMTNTFAYCENLTGNIYIRSENVYVARSCFNNSTLTKNVYIPFTYDNTFSRNLYCMRNTQRDVNFYIDINPAVIELYNRYNVPYVFDSDGVVNANIRYINYMRFYNGVKIYDVCFVNSSFYSINVDTENNLTVTVQRGDNTATYNAFIAAGYKTDGSVNGVYLKDIYTRNSTDWEFRINESTTNATLIKYIGTNNVVSVPLYVSEI